mmetsp:Transcript_92242/g.144823  ORF Transcript_92242/g.144823 Transcript_92242/m.144823 type:complete len:204 (+) Transcript_92242:108-719(+)|eukprot:CAMPEP_0169123746 /NCGR_PEP_ID=MMETSP1015-20121227/33953_1 /TAXON_ID=342587 /ORGANISM="Karlodinium micrum, Strain CCMP2283" /LENGTH=203 /DNA_ID=CAMNT_0009187111 /DNA_START=80 /DNA_END=688 /DNA_ORIENTATION=-
MPEKRIDGTDGVAYTYEEYAAYYKGAYKKKDIDAAWGELQPAKSKKGRAMSEANALGKAMAEAKVQPKAKPANPFVITAYHVTDRVGKEGILRSHGGFLPGDDGLNGAGIYFSEDVDQAMAHSRHDAEFLFEVFLNSQSDKVVPSTDYGQEYTYTDWCVSRAKVANKAVSCKELYKIVAPGKLKHIKSFSAWRAGSDAPRIYW